MAVAGGAVRPGVGRRLAAVAALFAPVLALAVVVATVFRDPGTLLFAVGCIVLAAVSIWYVLTRHGLPRLLGTVGAVLALAGLIVIAVRHLLPILAVLALLIVFGLAARYAVEHDPRALRAAAEAREQAPPARHGALIINPKSGGGKAARFELADEARKRGIRPIVLEPGDDLTQLAEQAIADGADVIGMAGGDGSQALVATIAMNHGVPHVCIPSGTRNHFALDLGLDREDVVGALDAYTDGVEHTIDLARVNDRIFVNNASLGVYARVVQSEAYRDAKLQTWAQQLPEMLGPGAPPIDLEFDGPDGEHHTDAPLILVSNNPYQFAQLAGAGTRPRIDTGRLGVLAARVRSAADVAQLATREAIGQSSRFTGLLQWTDTRFEVRSGAAVPVGLDGEAIVLQPPVRFEVLPGVLRVRVPRRAVGLSPAAIGVAPRRPTVNSLLRIAGGRPVEPMSAGATTTT